MDKLLLSVAAVSASVTILAGAAEDELALEKSLPAIFAASANHCKALVKAMEAFPADHMPKRFQNGKLVTIPPKDWCSGFFPGTLWYLYEYTKDPYFKEQATAFTERLIEPLRHDASNHDVGFRTYCSAGNALRLTGDRRYAEFLHDTAAALRTRYDDGLGLICSWNSNPKKKGLFDPQYVVIIDNMMNLELLEWDAKNGGDAKSDLISRSQADSTDAHHFRPDGSAYHVIGYNRDNGKIHGIYAGQGATVEGTWARGQAWAIYGSTMMYRETRVGRYLERAMSAADYWLEEPKVPADGIVYWDFNAAGIPNEERDASAAAVTASALLELSRYAPPSRAAKFRAGAVKMLASLASPAYFAAPGENGDFLIKHCVGHKPGGGEIDVPLNYADYYFLEALLRFKALRAEAAKETAPCCRAFYAPYRMDDFCWENDCLAMRAYGPIIMEPAPKGQKLVSSGFDVFNKCVPYPVLEKWLHMGSELSYHKDHGEGMDNYKVAAGRGCGGVGMFGDGGWSYEKNWKKSRVISEKPEEAVFELEYETYTINGAISRGCHFVKFEVRPNPGAPEALRMIGPGLDISRARQHNGVLAISTEPGFVANWEPEGVDGEKGSIGTAIILPDAAFVAIDEMDCIHLLQADKSFTYYAGACWSGAGRFRDAASWHAHVRKFAEGLKTAK